MELLIRLIKKILPKRLFVILQPTYHRLLAFLGAYIYRHPSRELFVVGVTGTKGKSSVTEILFSVLREAGYDTALISTIHFKINEEEQRNLYKMTMPGRFFVQHFLRKAQQAECSHVVIEMTSEGVKQFRHKHIDLDALIFTNLSPEHIESHGSFENYKNAKLEIKKALEYSSKEKTYSVSNIDNEHGRDFLEGTIDVKIPYSLNDVTIKQIYPHISFVYEGASYTSILQGEFNVYNILAVVKLALAIGISPNTIEKGLQNLSRIPGRVEYVDAGQQFPVIVDYAHTADSLEALYTSFPQKHKVCVLGNTGGGRDKWKRPEMARVAEKYCEHIILTNEDPYDENPQKIVDEMAAGMSHTQPEIILDRRKAIAQALSYSTTPDSVVLITGKGTDPYIMGAAGAKEEWSDAQVAREEIEKFTTS